MTEIFNTIHRRKKNTLCRTCPPQPTLFNPSCHQITHYHLVGTCSFTIEPQHIHPPFQATPQKKIMSSSDDNNSSFGSRSRSATEEFCHRVSEDFISKLQVDDAHDGFLQTDREDEASVHNSRHEEEKDGEDDEEDDLEFSFACLNPDGSPISADDVFQNGRIRPIYPLFDRSLPFGDSQDEAPEATEASSYRRPPLKKLFIEMAERDELEGVDEGTYCAWNGKTVEEAASPEGCRKSNSTGFSRLWRFRDLVHRSSSDGKDAFVFLNTHRARGGVGNIQQEKKDEEVSRERVGRTADRKEGKTKSNTTVTAKAQTAHEKHYVRNRAAKESDKRKSYLPYRQNLVGLGFFANVNGMTRNVHPF